MSNKAKSFDKRFKKAMKRARERQAYVDRQAHVMSADYAAGGSYIHPYKSKVIA